MSATRLLVLGVVRMHGQTHGYQVRRELLSWSADKWANVQRGSIYHALKKLAKDGLLRAVTTEESETGPERTVYELTQDGETEFQVLLARGLAEADERGTDWLSAAIAFMTALPRQEAIRLLRHRLLAVEARLPGIRHSVATLSGASAPEHTGELARLWLTHAEAMRDWVRGVLDRLEAGQYRMADDPGEHFGHPGEHFGHPAAPVRSEDPV
ncbi:PadR family transcriptional regulator [Goodfellowiella coeruleoviolacea]|uniref:DNA-binding transcriptional regulator, PadR family n=1 Tax=Goodfellowiella coeruleoviolacea TaxID=334858 RepID=A0AAE3KHZ5_9PSEU|nr:PadR family transcriptional regulator [Goodfellowiella coeruleoviolacea]MCP2168741.1 DNA-binding transcriptional regulator, PadR family [Goodfellowiella coeruleoviolacea]